MTAAQKTAKDKFKKAIEYRKKTGVSLKEAFAHVYGKKVGAVKKKAAPKKKAAVKKVAPVKAAPTKTTVKKVNSITTVSGVKKAAAKKVNGSHKDTKSHNVNIRVVSGVISKDINRSILSYEKLKLDLKNAMSDYKKNKDVVSKFYAKQKIDKLKHELRERKFVLTNLNKELKKIK